MTSPHQKAAQMLAAAADLLDQGQTVNRLSIALTAIGLGVLLVPMIPVSDATQPTAAIVAIVGIVELVFAARVAVHAARFRRLAEDSAAERLDIAAYDQAMVSMKFMTAKQAGKPIGRRYELARKLFYVQVASFGLQVVAAIGGSMIGYFNAF
jgi:hypothetical protein